MVARLQVRPLVSIGELARVAGIPVPKVRRDLKLQRVDVIHVGDRILRLHHDAACKYLRSLDPLGSAALAAFDARPWLVLHPRLVNVNVAARFLHVTPQHVRNLLRRGAVKHLRDGKLLMVSTRGLLDALHG